jgi:hypothetical protein
MPIRKRPYDMRAGFFDLSWIQNFSGGESSSRSWLLKMGRFFSGTVVSGPRNDMLGDLA